MGALSGPDHVPGGDPAQRGGQRARAQRPRRRRPRRGRQSARLGRQLSWIGGRRGSHLHRPGVWHGYENCCRLNVYNLCFSSELLRRELSWVREDPLLGYLLWAGPYSSSARGMLRAALDPATFRECLVHLDALAELLCRPQQRHWERMEERYGTPRSQPVRQPQGEPDALKAPDARSRQVAGVGLRGKLPSSPER
jgi:hypothetical protein